MKVVSRESNINIFGGVNPILYHMNNLGFSKIVEEVLGKRPKQSKYSYSEVIQFWMLSQFCGIEKLERVWKTAYSFKNIPDFKDKIPSHDTINRLMKYLSTNTITYRSKDNNESQVNYNRKMNKLLAKVLKASKLLDKRKSHTLDIDTVIIPTEVKDAKITYKKCKGYNPAVSVIDNIPVLLEMRNGNVNPRYGLKNHLKNTFDQLDDINVKIDKVRIDGAGYNRELINYLDSKNKIFYIRAGKNSSRDSMVRKHEKWRPVSIPISSGGYMKGDIISLEEVLKGGTKMFRVITTRHKKKNVKEGEYPYSYRSIITNDFKSEPEDVVRFYNMRGKEERCFDDLRNNFGWKYPAFSNMKNNTVFYIIGMISHVIYRYMVTKFSKLDDKITATMRLNTFRTIFILVASEITYNENNNDYELVFFETSFKFEEFMK